MVPAGWRDQRPAGQREKEERQEPRDVEVEPVVDRELHPDQQRGSEGGDGEVVADPGERSEQGEGDHRDLHDGLQPAERVALAPDAERRVASALLGDRPVPVGVQAGVDQCLDRDDHRGRQRPRRTELAARSASRDAAPGSSPRRWRTAQRERGELRQRGERERDSRAGAESSASRAATRVIETRASLVLDSSAKAVYGHAAQAKQRRTPRALPSRPGRRRRASRRADHRPQVEEDRRACAAGRSSQVPLHPAPARTGRRRSRPQAIGVAGLVVLRGSCRTGSSRPRSGRRRSPRVADVDHVGVHHVERDPRPDEQHGDPRQHGDRRDGRSQPLIGGSPSTALARYSNRGWARGTERPDLPLVEEVVRAPNPATITRRSRWASRSGRLQSNSPTTKMNASARPTASSPLCRTPRVAARHPPGDLVAAP